MSSKAFRGGIPRKKNTGTYIALSLVSLFVLMPLIYMVSTSFKSIEEIMTAKRATLFPVVWSGQGYEDVMSRYPFLTYIKNSVIVVAASTAVAVLFSTLAGYGFSRFQFGWRGALLMFILVTQMFPSVMLYVPYYKMMSGMGLSNTRTGLILVYIGSVIPFCTWMMYGFFNGISRELDEAAMIDGAGRLRTFARIVMPLTLPGLVSTTIYAFIQGWNEYMFAMVFTTSDSIRTLPVAIGQMSGSYSIYWNDLMAASCIASLPLIVLFLFLQKYFISNMTGGAVKG